MAASPIGAAPSRLPDPSGSRFFIERIQPLLEQRCYACHSSRIARPQGGLRLDSEAGWRRGGAAGPALLPGNPGASRLIQAVRNHPGVPAMPPAGRLPDSEIAALVEWVERGAPGPSRSTEGARSGNRTGAHWAFQPLRHPRPPEVRDRPWGWTPVDRFILARLQKEGLRPSPPADRRTLIRRATFDLTGLPPTPAEVETFLNDRVPGAYERLVDRLLASPRYGERWGRHWLDVVHYGDTHGYDKDKRRDYAWPYRDYVIRSLNSDKPYSRFVKEQIAGDVLFSYDPVGIVATGFIAAGPWDFVGHLELREGTVEKEKTRLLDRDDMIATTMSTFTSLTVHCARCHDHKFDPIPQREYYRLQAVFAGVDRGDRRYGSRRQMAERAALEERRKVLRTERASLQRKAASVTSPDLNRLDTEIREHRERLAALPLPRSSGESPSNGYHSAVSPKPEVEKWVQVDLGHTLPIDEIRLVPARPTDFADTAGFGFPVRFRVAISGDETFSSAETVADETAADTPNPGDRPYIVRLTGREARYVRVTATRLWRRTSDYVFALAELEVDSGGWNAARGGTVTSLDSIEEGRWRRAALVDHFDSRYPLPDPSDRQVADLLRQRSTIGVQLQETERARREQAASLVDVETRDGLVRTDAELVEIEQKLETEPLPQRVYAVLPHDPRPVRVLARGEVEQPREIALAGALSCVPGLSASFTPAPLEDEGSRRAALAEWIVRPENALTWRSIVNRVWHYHFGRGLVETPNDFGRNGARPTHPELLDWLALRFRDGGQSLKSLHRLIMLSAVYRQASQDVPAHSRLDADNRLLWRMNRQRLDAESIRDSVLAVSGKLDLRMGGPGFELFRFKDDHSPVYDHSDVEKVQDPKTWRRTVYRFAVRSVPNPFLESLDCADPNINTPVRSTTLTALQALALLNDPFMVQQSELFATRLRMVSRQRREQIDAAYRLAFGRPPKPTETRALEIYTQRHGLANTCRLLFNANEFLFID
jgi:hypothetical protein